MNDQLEQINLSNLINNMINVILESIIKCSIAYNNSRASMNMHQDMNVKRIIQHKAYRHQNFHSDKDKMVSLIKGINNLEIDIQIFKIMRILIRFFRFPLLILFSPIYKRIELEKQKYLHKYQEELIKTAGLVKIIIKQYNFASLQFYFKAGCINNEIELKIDSKQEPFMRFILQADTKLSQRARSDPLQQDKRLKTIEDYLRKGLQKSMVLQGMCIEQYLNHTSLRRYQIQKQIVLQRQSQKQSLSTKANSQIKFPLIKQRECLIQINGPQVKSIEDSKIANDYLCCRPYFYQNEIINQPETLVQEYKNYQYPFDRFLGDILLKTICGFLNARGGIIYIGIREANDTKKRVVVGQKYSQNAKQDLLKYFRILCEKISPEIVNQQFYKLEFVPLKNPIKKNQWVPGKYIVRLRVDMGSQKELYSFRKSDGQQLFAFRTENQVLTKRMGQQIIEIYRKRLTSSEQKEGYIKHSGTCKLPEMGQQLCVADSSKNKIDLPWTTKSNLSGKRNDIKKDKDSSIQFQKSIYYCLPNAMKDDFKKFRWYNGKSFCVFIEPKDQQQAECINILISKLNLKGQIIKISRLMEIRNTNMTHIQQVLENILYTQFSGNRIGLASYDEVVLAMERLHREDIDYKFIFCTSNNY